MRKQNKTNGSIIVEPPHYPKQRGECVAKLIKNSTVRNMALGLSDVPFSQIAHRDGRPRFGFMVMAQEEFYKRNGRFNGEIHIGAVAEALILIKKERKS